MEGLEPAHHATELTPMVSDEETEMWSEPFVAYEVEGQGEEGERMGRVHESGVAVELNEHVDVEREKTLAPDNCCSWCCWRVSCRDWTLCCLKYTSYYCWAYPVGCTLYGIFLFGIRPEIVYCCCGPCPRCHQSPCECKYCRGGWLWGCCCEPCCDHRK